MTKRRRSKPPEIKIGGGVQIDNGDFVAGDKHVTGDVVRGDKVGGDKVTIGDVTGGSNVVVGDNATITVNRTQVFHELREAVAREIEQSPQPIPEEQKEAAEQAVGELEQMAGEEEPDIDRLDKALSVLEEVAPDVVEIVINALTNPGAAVAKGLQVAIKAWRKARKL